MILELFTWLYNTLNGSPMLALSGSFLWGILSILLSPCHLASIPLIVGFIGGQGKMPVRRAFLLSTLFSLGLLITIAGIGVVSSVLGRMAGDIGPYGKYAVALVFFAVGLYLLGIIPLPFMGGTGQPAFSRRGYYAAFLLGLVFGVALGPCTFAYMAPVLGAAFTVASTNLPFAVTLVVAYALGHVSVIILAGTFSEWVQVYLNWHERSLAMNVLKKICGILVILGGVYLLIS